MLPRLLRSRALPSLIGARITNVGRTMGPSMVLRRALIAPPKAGDAPYMFRSANRELPGTRCLKFK
jgi:hypothetical protein